MAYRLPTFNISVGIWRRATPLTDSPDVQTVGQLKAGMRGFGGDVVEVAHRDGGASIWISQSMPRLLLLPRGTDIRRSFWWGNSGSGGDTVEIPLDSGMYWLVADVFDVAYGFPNEFRVAMIWYIKAYPAPLPFPAGYNP